MGLHMALNLQKHLQAKTLPPLHYSNRSMVKGQPLQDAGAIPESDFEGLVQASDLIFTMVWHPQQQTPSYSLIIIIDL